MWPKREEIWLNEGAVSGKRCVSLYDVGRDISPAVWTNECLPTPQHKNKSAIGCQTNGISPAVVRRLKCYFLNWDLQMSEPVFCQWNQSQLFCFLWCPRASHMVHMLSLHTASLAREATVVECRSHQNAFLPALSVNTD